MSLKTTNNYSTQNYISSALKPVLLGEKTQAAITLEAHFDSSDSCNYTHTKASDENEYPIELRMQKGKRVDGSKLEKYILTLHDPNTPSLKLCHYEFAEIELYYSDGEYVFADLSTFLSSNLNGAKCLSCVKQALKALSVANCYIADSSLILTNKCCEEGSPTSMKLASIFKYGQSWYQKQGAYLPFSIEHFDLDGFKEFLKKDGDFSVINLDLFTNEELKKNHHKILNDTINISNYNYLQSCQFLHNLTISELKNALKNNPEFTKFNSINNILLETQNLTNANDDCLIGDLLKNLVELESAKVDGAHKLLHQFNEEIIGFNVSHYLLLLQMRLKDKADPNHLFYLVYSLGLSFSRLEHLSEVYCQENNIEEDFLELFYDILLKGFLESDEQFKNEIDEKLLPLNDLCHQKWINNGEKELEKLPDNYKTGLGNCVKYFDQNHKKGLVKLNQRYFLGSFDFDHSSFNLSLLTQLKTTKVKDLAIFDPQLIERLNCLEGVNIEEESDLNLHEAIDTLKSNPPLLKKTLKVVLDSLYAVLKQKNLDFIFKDPSKKLDAFLLSKTEILSHKPLQLT